MVREKFQKMIENKIDCMEVGTVFIVSDFSDIAPVTAINMSLSRLTEENRIRRILRGIYDKPRYSKLLGEPVAADPSKVAYAIARKNRWSILPAGDTALNLLHLSTQMSVAWLYVSDGPYKEYEYNHLKISFRHTSNKEATGYSYHTGLLIQGLKALGKEGIDDKVIEKLRNELMEEERKMIFAEAKGTTAWIYEYIKRICREELV